MNSEKNQTRKRYEVVSLNKGVSIKVDKLMIDIENNTSHLKVTRGKVINYLLLNLIPSLKKKDFKDMEVEFYDIDSLLVEARKKVKEIKKQGGIVSLAEILPEALLKKPKAKSTIKDTKVRAKKAASDEAVISSETHSGGGFKGGVPRENISKQE